MDPLAKHPSPTLYRAADALHNLISPMYDAGHHAEADALFDLAWTLTTAANRNRNNEQE